MFNGISFCWMVVLRVGFVQIMYNSMVIIFHFLFSVETYLKTDIYVQQYLTISMAIGMKDENKQEK